MSQEINTLFGGIVETTMFSGGDKSNEYELSPIGFSLLQWEKENATNIAVIIERERERERVYSSSLRPKVFAKKSYL